jgi:transcriptional regulator with GAF, ATPase, and Fis domain
VVDCAAIPANLIESELFGHERGAFTDASERRIGAFEAANGGTIFLDEIGELPLPMQPKLLRALEERTVKRIGSQKPVRVDVQVIAATNRDLRTAVSRETFRPDLYYRLDGVRIYLPPLRARREDIPLLVAHFARRIRPDIDDKTLSNLEAALSEGRDWPGNIRELRNAVEKAILLGELPAGVLRTPRGGLPAVNVTLSDEPVMVGPGVSGPGGAFDPALSFRAAKDRALADWERGYLTGLLRHAQGNLSQAARVAQMDRTHLRDLLRRYQIDGR